MKRAAKLPLPRAEERERYIAAHRRYAAFRDAARQETELVAREVVLDQTRHVQSLRLTAVDGIALGFWDTHWQAWPSPHPEGNFPWTLIMDRLRTTPRRFDLAIWADDILCGLCAGMAAKHKRHLAVKYLETFHGPNPLKGLIAVIALDCADAYAHVLGAQRLKICNPVPGALPTYEALGFRLVPLRGVGSYCERGV